MHWYVRCDPLKTICIPLVLSMCWTNDSLCAYQTHKITNKCHQFDVFDLICESLDRKCKHMKWLPIILSRFFSTAAPHHGDVGPYHLWDSFYSKKNQKWMKICAWIPWISLTFYENFAINFFQEKIYFQNLIRDGFYGIPKLSEIRAIFSNSIIEQIKSYFPNHELNLFEIFLPKQIPTQMGDALTYGVVEINSWCTVFQMSQCLKLVEGWSNLLISMIDMDDFCSFKTANSEAYAFWSHFLNAPGIAGLRGVRNSYNQYLLYPLVAQKPNGDSQFLTTQKTHVVQEWLANTALTN